jgi:beta-glucosidase
METMKNKMTFAAFARLSSSCVFFLICVAHAPAQEAAFTGLPVRSGLATPANERRVEELLKQMTLEEKVGQLAQYSVGSPTGPETRRNDYADMAAKGQVGSLYNLADAKQTNYFQHLAVEKSRLHIPLVNGLDVIHGYRTVFPVPLGMAATWNPQVVERAARLAAQEASADGVRWTFSPMVDIARDARWGRITEGAGEDPFLGSEVARAYVRGYQGKNLAAADSVAACAKHYVGYGAAEGGRDYNTVELSEHTLREFYLPPFYAALDEGGATIMSAFNSLSGTPASANPFTLTQVLRKEWQFPGVVVSDWTSIMELTEHGIANDGATAARKAFNAGVDMDMQSDLYHESLADLVKSGKVSQARLDEAVRRVLRLKFALGLFENPYTDETRKKTGPLSEESLEIARTAAIGSLVLLKNATLNGGQPVLPLEKKGAVALIGPLADDAGDMLGSWAGHGQAADVVTLRTSLVAAIGADHVKYAKGGTIRATSDAEIEEAVSAAKGAQVVILALGENAPEMTGEAGSRAHLGLPGRQQELLEKVNATGTPVVLLLFTGRPLTLPWAFEHVAAAMAAWFPGVQAGPALVSVLYGENSPSGRLPVSWPRAVGQLPLYYNALNTGRPAGQVDLMRPPNKATEKYVSRYVDEQNSPQFPFGYGLSYTTFQYSAPRASTDSLSAKALNAALRDRSTAHTPVVTVSTELSNTGKVAAEEIAQLYVGLRGTSVPEPSKALKAFQRVSLRPGETKKVVFELTPEAFAFWGQTNSFAAESAKATIWVGPNSSDASAIDLTIGE